ncbi:MAG: sulfur carrier protein ThiS [Longimicrobiales bacterium]
MLIVVNGEERTVSPGLAVSELLDQLGLKPGMVVVEHNREIMAREALSKVALAEGDRIELVHFVGGG